MNPKTAAKHAEKLARRELEKRLARTTANSFLANNHAVEPDLVNELSLHSENCWYRIQLALYTMNFRWATSLGRRPRQGNRPTLRNCCDCR